MSVIDSTEIILNLYFTYYLITLPILKHIAIHMYILVS